MAVTWLSSTTIIKKYNIYHFFAFSFEQIILLIKVKIKVITVRVMTDCCMIINNVANFSGQDCGYFEGLLFLPLICSIWEYDNMWIPNGESEENGKPPKLYHEFSTNKQPIAPLLVHTQISTWDRYFTVTNSHFEKAKHVEGQKQKEKEREIKHYFPQGCMLSVLTCFWCCCSSWK